MHISSILFCESLGNSSWDKYSIFLKLKSSIYFITQFKISNFPKNCTSCCLYGKWKGKNPLNLYTKVFLMWGNWFPFITLKFISLIYEFTLKFKVTVLDFPFKAWREIPILQITNLTPWEIPFEPPKKYPTSLTSLAT